MSRPLMLRVPLAADAGLLVQFEWRGDRYAQQLSVVHGGETRPLLASVEGDSSQPWPASPPLQQLVPQTLADGTQVALGVGMAGSSHWSVSVELAARRPQVRWDVACRHRQPAEWMGSSFRWLIGADDPWRERLGCQPLPVTAPGQTLPEGSAGMPGGELSCSAVAQHADPRQIDPQIVRIAATRSASRISDAVTVRWRFVWRLAWPPVP